MATLLFADLEMLRQALAGDVVPAPISRSPAQGNVDAQGRVWLQPTVPLPGPAVLRLQRLGVRLLDLEPEKANSLHCWQQLLPLQPQPTAADENLPLLLEMPAAGLPALSAELWRLGHASPEFRWCHQPEDRTPPKVGDFGAIFDQHMYEAGPFGQAMLFMPAATPKPPPPPDDDRVLLRIKSPPLSLRLRIAQNELVAYWEQSPHVWVEANFVHPQVEQIEPPAGQIALLRHDRPWVFLDDLPFDHGAETFALAPVAPERCPFESADATPLNLPLKLEECDEAPNPEFWVLYERPLEQLADWVRSADDSLVARLEIALTEPRRRPILFLRLRPSKQPAPVLMLDSLGCRAYLRLPNLYLPCGMRLAPALRRDVARQTLAAAEQRLHVLLPGQNGSFVPVSVSESAFRPLPECVAHRVPQRRRTLTAGTELLHLEFEDFILKPETVPDVDFGPAAAVQQKAVSAPSAPAKTAEEIRPKAKSGILGRLKQLFRPGPVVAESPVDPVEAEQKLEHAIQAALPEDVVAPIAEQVPPSSLESRQIELEEQLRQLDEADLREKAKKAWPELAAIYTRLNQPADAAICWLNAICEDEAAPAIWYRGWLQAEKQAGRLLYKETELLPLLQATPSPASVRLLAAAAVWSCQHRPPAELMKHAGRIRQVLEQYENWLPVRAVWLAQTTLAKVGGGDRLALTRCRDRLFDRLGPNGLSLEHDVPSFVRFAGSEGAEQCRSVRDWLPRLRELIHRWHGCLVHNRPVDYVASENYPDRSGECTGAYIDLIFAWAMARLGEENSCRHLWKKGRETLERFEDPEHRFLLKAFGQRIAQVVEGKQNTGCWAEELLAELDSWQSELADERLVLARYRVDALRQQSRILANLKRQDAPVPFAQAHQCDPAALLDRARSMMAGQPPHDAERTRALDHLFNLAPRLGEPFSRELLDHLQRENMLPADPLLQALHLERELLLASHFGLRELVGERVARLQRLFEDDLLSFARLIHCFLHGSDTYAPLETDHLEELAGCCLAALQRVGMTAELERLRPLAERWILQRGSLGRLAKEQPESWPIALRALLYLGANMSASNKETKSFAALDHTRQMLLYERNMPAGERTALTCAYIRALAQARTQVARERIEQLFLELDLLYDMRKTNTHFALSPLVIVDTVVAAIIDAKFALDPATRRWLDDDELSIRRRLRNDLAPASC